MDNARKLISYFSKLITGKKQDERLETGELYQLAYGGQFGKKGIPDVLRIGTTQCNR